MGEFGAVSVVSGHIRGQTNTMPLHVEILYNEYQFAAAFAVASLLALLARRHAGAEKPGRLAPPRVVAASGNESVMSASKFATSAEALRRLRRGRPASICDVDSGELVALLGPSGSGKTTLLRIIAGLEPTDSGAIHFDGDDATDASVRERRRRLRVPALRAVPAHDRVREHRLRPARAAAARSAAEKDIRASRAASC